MRVEVSDNGKCTSFALLDQQLVELLAAPLLLRGELLWSRLKWLAFIGFFGFSVALVELREEGLE